MKHILEYDNIFESGEQIPQTVYVFWIINFLNYYHDIFSKNKNEFISKKKLEFTKNAKKHNIDQRVLLPLILKGEFKSRGTEYNLKYPGEKPSEGIANTYYRKYRINNRKRYEKDKDSTRKKQKENYHKNKKEILKKHKEWQKKDDRKKGNLDDSLYK